MDSAHGYAGAGMTEQAGGDGWWGDVTGSADLGTAALREKARREKARRELGPFCQFMMPQYPLEAQHLQLLARSLADVERFVASRGREGTGRLMVFMPPRYWKSQTTSCLFPAWFLGRNPECRVILTSYAGQLAFKFSRRVRDLIATEEYGRLFGAQSAVDHEGKVTLSRESRSVQGWDLAGHAGGMVAAGVGGGITGGGAHLLIVDDPVKDRQQAESETYREMVWEWWGSTAYTRLEAGAAVILIMTRWHVEDLAGRLLRQAADESATGGGERWRVLMLPAIAEEYGEDERAREPWLPEKDLLGRAVGEPLWPELHGREALEQIRTSVGPYNWPSLYQQWPRKREGQMFQRGWFRIVDEAEVPAGLRWVRYWDLAQVSAEEARLERKNPSYTCSAAVAVDGGGTVYVRDMIRGRWEWPDAQAVIKATMLTDVGVRHGVENKLHGKTAVQEFLRDPGLLTVALEAVNVEGGPKEVRALALQTRAHAGKVALVRGSRIFEAIASRLRGSEAAALEGLESGAWIGPYLDEAGDFPSGGQDDQVDTTTGGMQMLGMSGSATMEKVSGEVVEALTGWRG